MSMFGRPMTLDPKVTCLHYIYWSLRRPVLHHLPGPVSSCHESPKPLPSLDPHASLSGFVILHYILTFTLHAVILQLTNPDNWERLNNLVGKNADDVISGLGFIINQSPSEYTGNPPTVSQLT